MQRKKDRECSLKNGFYEVKTMKKGKSSDLPEYMNFKQAMKYLGIGSYDTLHYFIHEGLKVIVIGNINKISKTDADDFMTSHSKNVLY